MPVCQCQSMTEENKRTVKAVVNNLKTLDSKCKESPLLVQIMGTDLDGQLRGKALCLDKFIDHDGQSFESGFGFCSVLFEWDMLDRLILSRNPKEKSTFSDTGFPDIVAIPDPTSYIQSLPWAPSYPTFLVDFKVPGELKPLACCPRSILKNTIEQLALCGFESKTGMEIEWYNYKETIESLREKDYKNLRPLTPGMAGYSVTRLCANDLYVTSLQKAYHQLGLSIECFHTETGPGVFEAALQPSSPLVAADSLQLLKWATRVIAANHQIVPTFMAKVSEELPGCGGHIHISLWDQTSTQNIFEPKSMTNNDKTITIEPSEKMLWFIGGLLKSLPDLMPFFAPNMNSYKRLDPQYWAPIALTWGRQNRVAAVRWIPSLTSPGANRIEVRVGGSDLHPYLALAGILAAGLNGIQEQILPGPCSDSQSFKEEDVVYLPRDLATATARMKAKGSMARRLFGDEFIDKYTKTREWEIHLFSSVVTDWEKKRYLEWV